MRGVENLFCWNQIEIWEEGAGTLKLADHKGKWVQDLETWTGTGQSTSNSEDWVHHKVGGREKVKEQQPTERDQQVCANDRREGWVHSGALQLDWGIEKLRSYWGRTNIKKNLRAYRSNRD